MANRRRLSIVFVSVLVILTYAGGAALSPAGAQQTSDAASARTISVDATGTTTAPPDLAVIDVAVAASADSAEAARTAVAENVSSMRDALAAANVTDDQLRTTFYSIQMNRENGSVTYHAMHGFELRVPVEDAGSVVDTAVAGGATRIDGVRFALSDETRRQLRDDALEDAIATSRADAEVIASAIGVDIRSVQSVATADGGGGPVFAETASRDGTTFDPGPVTVSAHVSVTYEAS